MNWHDEIAQQRLDKQAEKVLNARHSEGVDAVKHSESTTLGALSSVAKSTDIKALSENMQKLQKTILYTSKLGSQESDALAGLLKGVGESLSEAIKELDSSERDGEVKTALTEFNTLLRELKQEANTHNAAMLGAMGEVTKAVKSIKLVVPAPEVNVTVPEIKIPEIKVPTQKIDLNPFVKQMNQTPETSPEEKTEIELEEYRAQDQLDKKDKQYFGFVHPTGAWYILENDIKQNQMRYVFGTKNYAKAWAKASTYQYQLLNEAIDAL